MSDTTIRQHAIHCARASLTLPLFALFEHMNTLGWDVSLQLPENSKSKGYVSFAKAHQWHNRPLLACRCSYGHSFDGMDEAIVLAAAQRSAELCLTIYEAFIDDIPGNPNIHGDIRADIIINQPKFRDLSYAEFTAKHQDKQFFVRPAHSPKQEGDVLVSFFRNRVTISLQDRPVLKASMECVKRKLSGELPFDC
jgi:hypothetical protein